MEFEGTISKLYRLAERITLVLYINLLWVIFSLVGLGLFGLFPSTAAMFGVVRKWMLGEKDLPIFKTFWSIYKSVFIQTNLLGYTLLIIGAVLYVDLRFFQTSEGPIFQALSFLFLFLLLIFFTVVLYIFPVFVHFNFKTLEYIKYSFILTIGKPIQTLLMIVGSILVLTLLWVIPILTLYFGGSILCFVLTWIAIKSFPKEDI